MTEDNMRLRIFNAVRKDDVEELVKILTGRQYIMADGYCAFHFAIAESYIRIVKTFVDQGYDINEMDPSSGYTPIMNATRHGRFELMKYLIQNQADVNKKGYRYFTHGVTALHLALRERLSKDEENEALKILVSVPGVKLNQTDDNGESPLIEAVCRGRLKAMQILIDAGCDVNFKNVLRKTAVHFCFGPQLPNINDRSVKSLRLLFAADACLDIEDNNGDTPLMYAINWTDMPAFKMLINANCRIVGNFNSSNSNCTNRYLEQAILRRNMKACQLLIRAGSSYHYLKTWDGLLNCRSPHIVEYLSECCNEIRTLKDLSRIIVRNCIGNYPQKKIHLLDIPASLKDYVLLSDLEVS